LRILFRKNRKAIFRERCLASRLPQEQRRPCAESGVGTVLGTGRVECAIRLLRAGIRPALILALALLLAFSLNCSEEQYVTTPSYHIQYLTYISPYWHYWSIWRRVYHFNQ
jgi:hypothetical protein